MSEKNIIEVEVHRKALYNMSKEMAITLMRTSGSPVVTDAKDFSTCILDANNEQLAFSGYVSFHISTAFLGVEAVLRNYQVEDIRPGDAFMCNDPHTSGAIHQGDVGIVSPYFYNGKLIGWGYVNEHVLDVGGSAISGFAPEARDCFSETLRFPGTRIMNEGVLSPEWERFISTNVRMPGTVLNDIRGMIAACNTGQRRLESYIEQLGLEKYNELNETIKRLSEKAFRERIAKIPNGTYDSEDWVEYDGHGDALLFNLKCRLIVEEDRMKLQFRGVPQTDSFINGAKPAMLGQAMTTVLCQLIYDIPVNSGIWEPIEIDLGPEGTIVNSVAPAPVTQSHMETGMRVNKVVADVLTQALSLSEDAVLKSRVAGQPSNGITSFTAYGVDTRNNNPFVIFPMSTAIGLGGGAQTIGDGLDTYAAQCMTGSGMPDVEIDESGGPVLVLWRKINQNSGGPGLSRGGQGVSSAMALMHAEQMNGTAFTSVSEVPPRGFFGGYPGSASNYYILKSSNLIDLMKKGSVPTAENLSGEIKKMPAKSGSLTAYRGDIFVVENGGGGGLGDPLFRSPADVSKDVRDGYVSIVHAQKVYGVVLKENGDVNAVATEEQRKRTRIDRIGQVPSQVPDLQQPPHVTYKLKNENWICAICDYQLSSSEENWRTGSISKEVPIEEHMQQLEMFVRPRVNPKVVVREHYCPNCATALIVDVTLEGKDVVASARLGSSEFYEQEVIK
jgi:N-methylhydantoinase B